MQMVVKTSLEGDVINWKSPRSRAIFNICQVAALPVDANALKNATRANPVLSKVLAYVRRRWPDQTSTCFKPYKKIRNELSVEGDYLLRGTRVIIPLKLRAKVLEELHNGHCGMVRMKALSRSYVWWPGLDEDISKVVKECAGCQSVHSQRHLCIPGLGPHLHGKESM